MNFLQTGRDSRIIIHIVILDPEQTTQLWFSNRLHLNVDEEFVIQSYNWSHAMNLSSINYTATLGFFASPMMAKL